MVKIVFADSLSSLEGFLCDLAKKSMEQSRQAHNAGRDQVIGEVIAMLRPLIRTFLKALYGNVVKEATFGEAMALCYNDTARDAVKGQVHIVWDANQKELDSVIDQVQKVNPKGLEICLVTINKEKVHQREFSFQSLSNENNWGRPAEVSETANEVSREGGNLAQSLTNQSGS